MFTQDDAELALNAVATYLNCETEDLQIVRGDEINDMIVVEHIHPQGQGSGTYLYQCSTGKVFPVNSYEDAEMNIDAIINSRID